MDAAEHFEILRFGQHSFRGDHDSRGRRACGGSPRDASRAAHDSAEFLIVTEANEEVIASRNTPKASDAVRFLDVVA